MDIPPVSMANRTVFINQNSNEAILLDSTMTSKGEAIRVDVPYAPIYMQRRNGAHNEVLILSKGHPGSRDSLQKSAALTLVNAHGRKTVFELGNNPFDTVIADPEGDYVFLMRQRMEDKLLENINEVAIISLNGNPDLDSTLVYRTLEGTPNQVFFSENFQIGGVPKKIACVASTDMLFIFDLEHLDRRPTSVYLGKNNSTAIHAEQIIFDGKTERIYVRSSSSDDIFSLKLTARVADEDRNDFATSIDIIGVGRHPSDMALYYESDNSKLFVVAEVSEESYIIDVATGKTIQIPFPGPIDRVHIFTRTTLGVESRHALVWKTNATEFYVIDFFNVGEQLGKNIRLIGKSFQPAKALLSVFEGNKMLLMHAGIGLSVIDLDVETISPFASRQPLYDSYLDRSRGRFWVAPNGQQRVAYVDISETATDDLILDKAVEAVVPVFDAGVLLVVHDSAVGYVTLIDVENPDRIHTRSIRGFLVENIL
ncbi:MAG: hypothetical protein JXX14_15830 [Deltaproteobacteria bacterium]|nr:hypothetical protein [Deltaproteobacteria bacterium]